MAADLNWPVRLLTPADAKASPIPFNTSGGQGFDSSEQIVGNTPGRWKIVFKNIYLDTPAAIATWQAIEAALQGRLGTVNVPACENPRAPWPTVNGKLLTTYGATPFSDGMLFDDGAGFYTPVIDAVAAADIVAGTNAASIQINFGAPLSGGHGFGFNEKYYRIRSCLSVDTSGAAPVYSVKFTLPCRETIPAGSRLDFDNPVIRCRLESDDAMALPEGFHLWRHAAPALTFWEDV